MNTSLQNILCAHIPSQGLDLLKSKTLNNKETYPTPYSKELLSKENAVNTSSVKNNDDINTLNINNTTPYDFQKGLQKQKEHKSPVKVLFNTNAKPQLQAIEHDINTNPAKPFFIHEMGLSEELVKFLNETNALAISLLIIIPASS